MSKLCSSNKVSSSGAFHPPEGNSISVIRLFAAFSVLNEVSCSKNPLSTVRRLHEMSIRVKAANAILKSR